MKWLPIYDAPKDGRFVLAMSKSADVPLAVQWKDGLHIGFGDPCGKWLNEEGCYMCDPPTHYMEIPEL